MLCTLSDPRRRRRRNLASMASKAVPRPPGRERVSRRLRCLREVASAPTPPTTRCFKDTATYIREGLHREVPRDASTHGTQRRVELRVAGSVSFVISLRPSVVEDPLGAGAMHDFAAVMKAICTGLARPQTKIVLFSNGLQVLLCMIDVHGQ